MTRSAPPPAHMHALAKKAATGKSAPLRRKPASTGNLAKKTATCSRSSHGVTSESAKSSQEVSKPRVYVAPIPDSPFDEIVYDLLPIFLPPEEKTTRHRSKFAGMARKEYRTGVKPMASMGAIRAVSEGPDVYLKKGDGDKLKPEVPRSMPDRSTRKAPLMNDSGVLPDPTNKNFIKDNVIANIHSTAKPPPKEPRKYLNKTNYGKTPPYVTERQHVANENEHQQELAAAENASGLALLPEPDRIKIVAGLQCNWEKLNSEYQHLSLTVDTVPKIARKVNIEQQLKRLEQDIQRFSHEYIYVDVSAM